MLTFTEFGSKSESMNWSIDHNENCQENAYSRRRKSKLRTTSETSKEIKKQIDFTENQQKKQPFLRRYIRTEKATNDESTWNALRRKRKF